MVLKKALSFVANSFTPKANSSPTDVGFTTPKASVQVPQTHKTSMHKPERRESASSSKRNRKDHASRQTQQQETEVHEFSGYEDEEKTQSYASEADESESEGSVAPCDLIEISLGGDELTNCHLQNQFSKHNHHHNHHMRHYHSASDLETIDELIELAKEGNVQAFRRTCESLATRSVSANSPGYMGWTPAHWAAREGHIPILEYLLSVGVSLDARDRKGDSLLHKAAANGQYRTCQWLLQLGFNVQAKNNNGKSALDVAQEHLAIERTSEAALCEAILARENANTF